MIYLKQEATQIKSKNFKAMKMKVGLGPIDDLKLVRAVRDEVGQDFKINGRCKPCL